MKTSFKVFLAFTAALLATDLLFVGVNHRSARQALDAHLQHSGTLLEGAFVLAFDNARLRMLEIATFAAHEPQVQQAFLRGKHAVEREGGGAGGPDAATARAELLLLTRPSRTSLAEHFDFRQLHFHLGPGSTSFLRVHRPEKFGDTLDQIRHTVVVANRDRQPTSGFETGRLYSGIRGVVPVTAPNAVTGEVEHAGALEAGTSFRGTLAAVARSHNAQAAVLLTREHLESAVWPEFLAQLIAENPFSVGFLVEETTDPGVMALLNRDDVLAQLGATPGTRLYRAGEDSIAVTSFRLRDFLGERDPARPDVGRVLAWRDVGPEVAAFHHNVLLNLTVALGGFVLVEVLLFLGVRLATRTLEDRIERGREELAHSNDQLHIDIKRRMVAEHEKEAVIGELREALTQVHTLSGLLPICAWCKKIRDEEGYWKSVEVYVAEHSDAEFSHGICAECLATEFPEFAKG